MLLCYEDSRVSEVDLHDDINQRQHLAHEEAERVAAVALGKVDSRYVDICR